MAPKTFVLSTEYIELQQLLKALDLVGSGGEAKAFLLANEILINGEPDRRRAKKLRVGDIVQIGVTKVIIT